MLVTLNVAMDINFRMEQQLWKLRALALQRRKTRGHCQTAVQLKAMVETKTALKPGSFFQEVTLKNHHNRRGRFFARQASD